MTGIPPRKAAPPQVDAVRLDGKADFGDFTYTVLIDPQPLRNAGDRRDAPRRRTRLRSGKVVDARGQFVTECLVHDLSETGVRLRLPVGVVLPAFIHVYDDQSGTLQRAEISWRRDGEAGVHFVPMVDTPRNQTIAADMRRKFYKLPR